MAKLRRLLLRPRRSLGYLRAMSIYLVTGGCGFIGSNLVRVLAAGGNNGTALAIAELFTPPPGLSLSPKSGPVGSSAAASGVAFRASQPITLTFNGIPVPSTCATDAQVAATPAARVIAARGAARLAR